MSIDKNVYILGAGFSYDAKIPLMNDFMDKARHLWALKYGQFVSVFEYARRLLSSSRVLAHNVDNIEELFSLLELNIQLDRSESDDLTFVRDQLIELIRVTITDNDITRFRCDAGFNSMGVPNGSIDLNIRKELNACVYTKALGATYFFDIYQYFVALVFKNARFSEL